MKKIVILAAAAAAMAQCGAIDLAKDIDGKRELREINAEFQARYVSASNRPDRSGCGMGE